ncbi:MAG: sigma factor-like helix-turn-helix DNA-binding protein [Lachnospiraceae bacterium]
MDKKTLKQYKSLQNELKILDKKIDRLYDRQAALPTVMGKVTKSSDDFPYIEEHVSVQMDEPKEAEEIRRLLLIRENMREQVRKSLLSIETFIAAIPDSTNRQIFELTFLDGKKQREVADEVGYSRSRISQIINDYLKD